MTGIEPAGICLEGSVLTVEETPALVIKNKTSLCFVRSFMTTKFVADVHVFGLRTAPPVLQAHSAETSTIFVILDSKFLTWVFWAIHGASRRNRTVTGPIPRDCSTFELWRRSAGMRMALFSFRGTTAIEGRPAALVEKTRIELAGGRLQGVLVPQYLPRGASGNRTRIPRLPASCPPVGR